MLQKLDTQKALFLNNNKLNVALTAGVYGGIYIPTVYEVAEEPIQNGGENVMLCGARL